MEAYQFCLRAFFLSLGLVSCVCGQVPHLLSYQGRVSVDDAPFNGVGQFKFSLVNSNGTATFWSNDAAAANGQEPAAAIRLPVANGFFSVLLGDTTLTNMSDLPPAMFSQGDVRLRVWFNDGTNGFSQLIPDQRLAAVGYAMVAENVPDGSISLAKLAADVHTALGASAVPRASVVMSYDPDATNLVNAGFIKLAAQTPQVEWKQSFLETSFDFGTMLTDLTNLWVGVELWIWRWGVAGAPGTGIRYNPSLNRWSPLTTNGAPALDSSRAAATWIGTEFLVAGASAQGVRGSRYHPTLNTWTPIATNGAPLIDSQFRHLLTGTELVVLGDGMNGIQGGRYQPAQDSWQRISTNGFPAIDLASAKILGWGDGLILFGNSADGLKGARYHLGSDTWTAINTNSGLVWSPDLRDVWTGSDWLFFSGGPAGFVGARYRPLTDTWSNLNTNGAPVIEMNTRMVWANSELVVLTFGFAPTPDTLLAARYNPITDQWRPISRFGPSFSDPPTPDIFFTGSEVLVIRRGEPSKWAKYSLAADRWTLLNGPMLGYDVFSVWTGTELLSFVTNPPFGQEPMVYQYTPGAMLYLYQKP